VEIIGWKARDRVRRKKSRDEKGHALSLTTQRPTKETAGEQTGAATSHNAATKPREFCECSDEDDSCGMRTIWNVLDVNHDARWGFVDHLERGTEQLNGHLVAVGGKNAHK
tara:strand:- start:638 stop:970 length:333 start_codon:yes stop_codon:yes gene_type:complete